MKFLKKTFFLFFLFFMVGSTASQAEVVDQIIAEVNGEIITYSELKRILDPIYAQYSKVYGGDELIGRVRQARGQALDQLIENKLILQEAQTMGLEMNEKAVEKRIKEIKSRFPTEEAFLETLKREGSSYDSFVDQVENQLLIKALVSREVTSKVIVSPREIETYYNDNKEKFSDQERVQLFHIMVKKDPENLFLSQETARQIYRKVEAGDDFKQLAKDYSEGPNAEKGGDLGLVVKGQLIPELSEIAFSLPVKKVSEVIETDGAYHLLWVDDKTVAKIKPLEEVERLVEDAVFRKKATEKNNKWIVSLKEKAYINIFE